MMLRAQSFQIVQRIAERPIARLVKPSIRRDAARCRILIDAVPSVRVITSLPCSNQQSPVMMLLSVSQRRNRSKLIATAVPERATLLPIDPSPRLFVRAELDNGYAVADDGPCPIVLMHAVVFCFFLVTCFRYVVTFSSLCFRSPKRGGLRLIACPARANYEQLSPEGVAIRALAHSHISATLFQVSRG
jgi:hypothetical protein